MTAIPYIPESAPFTAEQRAWLNGFLAGLLSQVPADASIQGNGKHAGEKPGEPLLVLFGSQTGSAESIAKRVAKESEMRGFKPKVAALNDFESVGFATAKKAVIVSSTWGDGDPPDNATTFWSWLRSESAPRLEQLQFAVLGLGDRNYSDFCGASKKFDARLEALGAKRLVDRGECDEDYEATTKAWIEGLWQKLGGRNGASHPLAAGAAVSNNGVNGKIRRDTEPSPSAFGRSNLFPSRLLKNVLLNKAGSCKEVRHYELSLEGSRLHYEVGDALGVMPANCPELVSQVIASLGCRGDEPVTLGEATLSLREATTRHFDITRPSSELLTAVAQRAPECELAPLLATERAAELRTWMFGRDVLDILRFLRTPLPLPEMLPLLRKLAPRLYSIASSPKAHPGEVHLTVSAVRYECLGRGRKGVASTFLADRVGDADYVRLFVQPSSTFKLPKDGDVPIVMVGPGTGIAPFRAFLEERRATGAKGKNWLFFGDQKRAADFLYEAELTAWTKEGSLTRLDLASIVTVALFKES